MSTIETIEIEKNGNTSLKPDTSLPYSVIEPRSLWSELSLKELWRYRELFYFLTWRDVKVRYKQTVLGIAWAVIQPLFNMLLFTLLFGKLAKLPSDNIPYPLFAFAGLFPWTFFANAISTASNSLVGNSHLITKVYFPRLIIPAAAILAALVDFAFAFGTMALLVIFYRVPLTIRLLALPGLVLITVALSFAVGTLTSALQVKYRDIRYIVPFLIQFWMFATPIIYPASMMPPRYRIIYNLNPMAGIIEGYRTALLSGINNSTFDWLSLFSATLITLLILFYSIYSFRRLEKTFADIV